MSSINIKVITLKNDDKTKKEEDKEEENNVFFLVYDISMELLLIGRMNELSRDKIAYTSNWIVDEDATTVTYLAVADDPLIKRHWKYSFKASIIRLAVIDSRETINYYDVLANNMIDFTDPIFMFMAPNKLVTVASGKRVYVSVGLALMTDTEKLKMSNIIVGNLVRQITSDKQPTTKEDEATTKEEEDKTKEEKDKTKEEEDEDQKTDKANTRRISHEELAKVVKEYII